MKRCSRFFIGHRPPHVYPCAYLMVTHMTLSPRPSSSILHTASDQKLEAGTRLLSCYVDNLYPRSQATPGCYLAAVENKIWEWPGDEARYLLLLCVCSC